jgi:isopentenyl diphosphate isomerase/L-lactate dehydrogenase-like FMN-dependent dehydrogenase
VRRDPAGPGRPVVPAASRRPVHGVTGPERPLTLGEYAGEAQARLGPAAWAYYSGGAGDETTLRANVDAWASWALRPRVLVDVSEVDLGGTVLGERLPHPLVTAPMAFMVGAHPEGERAMARAAAATGTTYTLSTSGSTSPHDVAAAAPDGRRWFQLYVRNGLEGARQQIAEAVDAGCTAVLLTVDLPVVGVRDRELRNPWAPDAGVTTIAASGRQPLASLTWRELEALVRSCPVPVLTKGILDRRDARRAVEVGCAGVVVSNHGGRQLDRVLPTALALPEVVEEVGSEVDVLVDGGVRRGVDAVTALALGARAVLVGRPLLWGLAVEGAPGAERVLRLLLEEMRTTLALLGIASLTDLSAEVLAPAPWTWSAPVERRGPGTSNHQ